MQMDEQGSVSQSLSGQPAPEAATQDERSAPTVTQEALVLVERADQGGVPMYTTANLARIAKENGVSVAPDMTPNQIIDELRRRIDVATGDAGRHDAVE